MIEKKSPSVYYQKSAFVLRISRYVVTLLFVIFLLACILIFGKDITAENVQLLAKYITLNDGSYSLYNKEFSITADEKSDIFIVSDNLAVVRNNNLSLYDLGGQKLFSYDYSYSLPASTANSRNIVVYDIAGKQASVFNTFSKIKSFDFTHGVTDAYINDKGIVLVSNEESYKSSLYVYNSDYKLIYKLLSANDYITGAVLSKDARCVLMSSANSSDGSFDCKLSILDVSKETSEPVYKYTFSNELPIELGYSSDGTYIYAVTDSSIQFFDTSLALKSIYQFNQSKIESYFIGNDMIILTEKNNISGNSMTLIGLSADGKQLFKFNLSDRVSDIAIGKDKFFALGRNSIFEFTNGETGYTQTRHIDINEKFNALACDSKDNCYVATNTKFKRIDFDIEEENIKK